MKNLGFMNAGARKITWIINIKRGKICEHICLTAFVDYFPAFNIYGRRRKISI